MLCMMKGGGSKDFGGVVTINVFFYCRLFDFGDNFINK